MNEHISIPVKEVGPIKIVGNLLNDEFIVPLATYETPLWSSVNRGARLSRHSDGIKVSLIDDKMTRSIILESDNIEDILKVKNELNFRKKELDQIVGNTSNYAKLKTFNIQIVGNLLYIRFEFETGEASGHNMVTKASDLLISRILNNYKNLHYVSVSGNLCTDKKVSCINGILGRGKNVIAEINISESLCKEILKTTPKKINELNIKKNLIGSILSGSIRSANAHYANILLAMYLPLGQDAANIIEGSQGITYTKVKDDGSLYFSVNCPNIIVGTIGNGKEHIFVEEYLKKLKCFEKKDNINNSQKLAGIIASTILCSEISLLAALTNQGELMKAHELLERKFINL
ncbi:MAG: hydroxymethylglutaryl-CoA reductase [Bacteroidetes bacterium]|nr:hydroxymethylglutaryl-CoA reductase [Bacteroidota bacterium]